MVEVEGERVLAASCIRHPAPGMKVKTDTERARHSRRGVFELLLADQPARAAAHEHDSRFWGWTDRIGLEASRFPVRDSAPAPDASHPAMRVALDACIQCNLCVRACREVQVNDVIGMAWRGHGSSIVFDFDDPMGESTCVACGECVQACPTGALMEASLVDEAGTDRRLALRRGRERMPLLRGRVPDHLPHRRGRPDRGRQRPERAVQRAAPLRQGTLRLRLRRASRPAHPPPSSAAATPRSRRTPPSIPRTPGPTSGRRAGRRPSTGRRTGSAASATGTAAGRWPGSAPPRGRTRRRTSSRR